MSRIWDSVSLESTLAVDVPIQSQEGDNAMLLKSPLKDLQAMSNQREILLADQEAKVVAGAVRKQFAEALQGHVVESQWGDGFGARSCELAHLALASLDAVGQSRRLCVVRLFIDVIQAFASIVVALCLPMEERASDARTLLAASGLSNTDIDSILADGHAAEEWRGTSEHLLAVVSGFQREQWVAADYHGGVMCPQVGTTAGVPLAGLVACAAISTCTRRIKGRLLDDGLLMILDGDEAQRWLDPEGRMRWPSDEAFANVGIVDDDVYAHLCPASEVEPAIARMATIIFEEYTKSGLSLHLQAMKTACLVTWQGEGSLGMRRHFEETISSHQEAPFTVFGKTLVLPATQAYRHVGCWARANMRHDREVALKSAIMKSAAKPLMRHVLRNT